MKKLIKLFCLLFAVGILIQCFSLISDKHYLDQELIRLHVVANSDDTEDQQLKLSVRDAVLGYLQEHLDSKATKEEAMTFLRENLQRIKQVAEDQITQLGFAYPVQVTLKREEFPTRTYDTFALPAGVYDALRVNIGNASGKNWWCVAFPQLCLSATSESFVDTAAQAGLSDTLTHTLEREGELKIRFFLLEKMGLLENFLHRR